jgi:four helix bundle protein
MHSQTSFRDLDVWQQSMLLVEEIYSITQSFPPPERFGLTAQLRRAAVSIPSNIGEGARRRRPKPFRHHLEIALGSQGEVEVQLEIALRLGMCDRQTHQRLSERAARVGRMLSGLIESIRPEEDVR